LVTVFLVKLLVVTSLVKAVWTPAASGQHRQHLTSKLFVGRFHHVAANILACKLKGVKALFYPNQLIGFGQFSLRIFCCSPRANPFWTTRNYPVNHGVFIGYFTLYNNGLGAIIF